MGRIERIGGVILVRGPCGIPFGGLTESTKKRARRSLAPYPHPSPPSFRSA